MSLESTKKPKKNDSIIISCAITGSIHTPTMSDHLPLTPDQIADEAIRAAKAGASILHLHARDLNDARPSPDPDIFEMFVPKIQAETDAVINITTGGGHNMTVDQRIQAAARLQPEMCSLNMGSMNFGLFPITEKFNKWKYDWEPGYLENTRDFIFKNTFKDIETILEKMGKGYGTRFEFECYDIGHLYNLAHFVDRGLVEPPFFVQSIFGILGGIGPEMENLMHMKRTADRLFGDSYEWSILGAGRYQMDLVTAGALLGGNVRVGLEDSLYLGKGQPATSNEEQVAKIRHILETLSRTIATPAEVRERLRLKGLENTAFPRLENNAKSR